MPLSAFLRLAPFALVAACSSSPVTDDDAATSPTDRRDTGMTGDSSLQDAGSLDGAAFDGSRADVNNIDGGIFDASKDATIVDASDASTTDAHTIDAKVTEAAVDATNDATVEAAIDAKTCIDRCAVATRQCAGTGYAICQVQSNGCTDWASTISCNAGEFCSAGQCVPSCTNQCTSGAAKCATSTSVSTCSVQSNGCTEWNTATPCPPSQSCINGACKGSGTTPTWKAITPVTNRSLQKIWGTAYNDIFAVGQSGTILHYDGNTWSPMAAASTGDFAAVWGSSSKDVWAVANGTFSSNKTGDIVHYDGTKWTIVKTNTESSSYYLTGVGGSSPSDVWVLASLYGGSNWTTVVEHFDGQVWSTRQTIAQGRSSAIASFGNNRTWAGTGGVAKFDGTKWQTIAGISGLIIYDVVTTEVDKFWVAGEDSLASGGLARYDGTSLKKVTGPSTAAWLGMARVSDSDLWLVGLSGSIARGNAQGFTVSGAGVTTQSLSGVWASGPDDAWAVGAGGTMLHFSP